MEPLLSPRLPKNISTEVCLEFVNVLVLNRSRWEIVYTTNIYIFNIHEKNVCVFYYSVKVIFDMASIRN